MPSPTSAPQPVVPGRWRRLARCIVQVLALTLSALAVGAGSAWWVLRQAPWAQQSLKVGAWGISLQAGSVHANAYTRARVALDGLLALGRDETLYYVAKTDDLGRPLQASCHYRISGPPPAARWWSITAYAQDFFLFDAPNRHFSFNSSQLATDGAPQFTLQTGTHPSPLDPDSFWLPTPGQGGVILTLRLYNPSLQLQTDPAQLAPPTITRLGDCP